MMANPRVVFDCNIFFQALISPCGPSGQCVKLAFQGELALFCSTHVIDELRSTATSPKVRAKFSRITDAAIVLLIENIERVATFLNQVPERFVYPHDPDDAHYVNLALAAKAKYVVSRDNDLLALMDVSRPEARDFVKLFPSLRIIEPQTLLQEVSETKRQRKD